MIALPENAIAPNAAKRDAGAEAARSSVVARSIGDDGRERRFGEAGHGFDGEATNEAERSSCARQGLYRPVHGRRAAGRPRPPAIMRTHGRSASAARRRIPSRSAMNIIVLGAGILGVTSAWYLRRDGHDVTVIDRQPGAGLETSYANGSQISVSYAEPWANPGAPLKILKWLGTRRLAAAVPAERRPASVGLGPVVPRELHAGTHALQHDPADEPRHLQPRHADRAARRDRRSNTTS